MRIVERGKQVGHMAVGSILIPKSVEELKGFAGRADRCDWQEAFLYVLHTT